MAVQYWVDLMDRDVRKAEEEHKQALLEQELAKFHQHVFGGGSYDSSNWIGRR